jgi:hypothetical protein
VTFQGIPWAKGSLGNLSDSDAKSCDSAGLLWKVWGNVEVNTGSRE